jgi:hypothetical protein
VIQAVRAMLVACLLAGASNARAQTVVLEGPAGTTLPSLTPAFTLRASGFGASRPLTVTLQIATVPDFTAGVLVDSTFTTADTVVAIQVTRLLTSEAQVFWRARVSGPDGGSAESVITGPRTVPVWLELIEPNSPAGDIVDSRRPRFVWRSARVTPLLGVWRYAIEVTVDGRAEQGAAGLLDTTYRAETDLQTSTSYKWSIRATLDNGTNVTANSKATFLVTEEPLPLRTLLYQNFPNPFPSPVAFSTCIWFDVASPGARLSLDVTDLRGNLIKTLIPGVDGQRDFQAGRYGRGAPGAGSTCDNRFVWDGTGNDGRSVAAGVYLLRFQSGRGAPTFRRMLFIGR